MTTNTQHLFTLVNTFTAIAGGLDELEAFQLDEMEDMSDEAATYGWISNEVYRSSDATRLIVLTRFRSESARNEWARTDRFRRHVLSLEALVHSVESVPVTLVATHGESTP